MDITLVFQMINIIILMFLLNKVLYKPVLGILRQRSEKMRGTQQEIERFKKDAGLRQEEVDKKMALASGKAKAALDSARAEAAAAGNEKLSAIKAEVEAEKQKKMTDMKTQIDTAGKNLQENLAGFASDMAGKILGRSL
ncbi:ATP synthase F0 subunit B [Desulfopila inferna]|uniref:ATP synthase F0 subunit B n=1 Tax=Desulfopila inferna TaxID=468528 RepID=UPI0027D2A9AA|nr:ATP synthase F0 subunit B [Desulfopila inferna]